VVPKDVWSEDANERSIALQERSDAAAADTTPSINALAPLEPVSQVVLVRRVADGWLEAKRPDEATALIASGEYRPFTATEGYTDSGTLCCRADPEWVEFGRRERITAVVAQQARADMEEMTACISVMSDEEIDALEASVMGAAGEAPELLQGPQ
jgi:hypothetical protein